MKIHLEREEEIYCWQEIDLSVRWIETRLQRLLNVCSPSFVEERKGEKGVKARAEEE